MERNCMQILVNVTLHNITRKIFYSDSTTKLSWSHARKNATGVLHFIPPNINVSLKFFSSSLSPFAAKTLPNPRREQNTKLTVFI